MDPYSRRQIVSGIILMLLFALGLIGEAMRDKTMRNWAAGCLAVAGLGLMAVVVLIWALLGVRAHAHDLEHPELDNWYMGLRSPGHGPCCDGSETTHLADVDWDSHDGHYRVRLDGQWVDVPDDAVVTEPNRDGRALLWAFKGSSGWYIRCFMPGAGS